VLGTLAAAGLARADDWQICNANQPPDQVLSACSAVIEQRARNRDLSRAYLVRGEWYRVHRDAKAVPVLQQGLAIMENSLGAGSVELVAPLTRLGTA